jgi:glycosyltransferase involved in cell wall biosynthesis
MAPVQVYRPLNEDEKARVKNELSSGSDYFVYVGSFHKRKNISRLLEAYDLFRRESARDIKLVLVGEKMYDYPQMNATLGKMIHREDVIFTGRMELPGLRRTYGAALALVYVPMFEGFGIPVLEAMYCDIPVIASNCTSLPEVAGDAALLVDPENAASIAGGMHRIAFDPELRNKLIGRSAVRRKKFSWDRTATLLWESVLKVANRF